MKSLNCESHSCFPLEKKYLLVYDSDCGPCSRFSNVIRWLDKYGRVKYSSLIGAGEQGLLDRVPKESRYKSFHLISPEGSILSGSFAIPILIGLFPLGSGVASLIRRVPIGQQVVSFFYNTTARLHNGNSCNSNLSHENFHPNEGN